MNTNRVLNPLFTAEQERIREVVFAMFKEERTLEPLDLEKLAPFVQVVREEITKDTTPGKRRIYRTYYYMLNPMGRQLYEAWARGDLDKFVPAPSPA